MGLFTNVDNYILMLKTVRFWGIQKNCVFLKSLLCKLDTHHHWLHYIQPIYYMRVTLYSHCVKGKITFLVSLLLMFLTTYNWIQSGNMCIRCRPMEFSQTSYMAFSLFLMTGMCSLKYVFPQRSTWKPAIEPVYLNIHQMLNATKS